eukprot:Gb_35171 [translate_table: standard]
MLLKRLQPLHIGKINELQDNTEQAIKWLEMVITRVMHDAGVLALLGNLYSKCEDEAKALHYYSEAHRVYPSNMDNISWLGSHYMKNQLHEKAMYYFSLASEIEPNEVKWQLKEASCYKQTGAYPVALSKYKEILVRDPNNVECLQILVQMYGSLGNQEEVENYLARLKTIERAKADGGNAKHRRSQSYGNIDFDSQRVDHKINLCSHPSLSQANLKKSKFKEEWKLNGDLLPL